MLWTAIATGDSKLCERVWQRENSEFKAKNIFDAFAKDKDQESRINRIVGEHEKSKELFTEYALEVLREKETAQHVECESVFFQFPSLITCVLMYMF